DRRREGASPRDVLRKVLEELLAARRRRRRQDLRRKPRRRAEGAFAEIRGEEAEVDRGEGPLKTGRRAGGRVPPRAAAGRHPLSAGPAATRIAACARTRRSRRVVARRVPR